MIDWLVHQGIRYDRKSQDQVWFCFLGILYITNVKAISHGCSPHIASGKVRHIHLDSLGRLNEGGGHGCWAFVFLFPSLKLTINQCIWPKNSVPRIYYGSTKEFGGWDVFNSAWSFKCSKFIMFQRWLFP